MYKIVFSSTELGELTLTNNPKNISDIDSYYVRSEKYHSISQRIEDVSFIWVLESEEYIKNIITTYGAGAVVDVAISYTDNQIDYSYFYGGKLDLTSYRDLKPTVECRVVQSDQESKVWNNIETDYKVYLPSNMTIKRRDELFTGTYELLNNVTPTDFYELFQDYYTPARFYAQTFEATRILGSIERYKNVALTGGLDIDTEVNGSILSPTSESSMLLSPYSLYYNDTENSIVQIAVSDLILNVTQANYIASPPTGSYMNIILVAAIIGENNEVISESTISTSANILNGTTSQTINFSASYTIPALTTGQKVAVYLKSTQNAINPAYGSHSIFYQYNPSGELIIRATEYKTNTVHKSISIPRALNRLVYSAISNESLTADPTFDYLDSELFESGTRYGRTYITSGKELRQITTGDGTMNTSISELFDSLNVPFCCGLGLTKAGDEVIMKLDHRSEFYKPEVVLNLGEVSDLVIEFAPEYLFNMLNINYPSVDNKDYPNGIYEYLTKYTYTTPLNYVDNSLENSGNYKVDATSIEELRTNQVTDTQENQQDDTTNFMIRCVLDGGEVFNSNGSEFDSISQSGLQNNTQLFNVDMFAPVTYRFWAWFILTGLEFNDNAENIVIQKSEQNGDVAITIDGVTCDTNDVTIAKLKELAGLNPFEKAQGALIDPYRYTFTAPMTVEKIEIFNANRHNAIGFTNKGDSYEGFGMKIPALPKRKGEFELVKSSKRAESYV